MSPMSIGLPIHAKCVLYSWLTRQGLNAPTCVILVLLVGHRLLINLQKCICSISHTRYMEDIIVYFNVYLKMSLSYTLCYIQVFLVHFFHDKRHGFNSRSSFHRHCVLHSMFLRTPTNRIHHTIIPIQVIAFLQAIRPRGPLVQQKLCS